MSVPGEKQFTEWWKQIESRVLSIGFKYLCSTEASQDLAQDIAIAALNNISLFKDFDHFKAWVIKRTKWLALDRFHFKRNEVLESSVKNNKELSVEQGDATQLAEVLGIISKFPHNQKIALLMTYEGYSTLEIAKKLNTGPATVRSLKRHARFRLLHELDTQ